MVIGIFIVSKQENNASLSSYKLGKTHVILSPMSVCEVKGSFHLHISHQLCYRLGYLLH